MRWNPRAAEWIPRKFHNINQQRQLTGSFDAGMACQRHCEGTHCALGVKQLVVASLHTCHACLMCTSANAVLKVGRCLNRRGAHATKERQGKTAMAHTHGHSVCSGAGHTVSADSGHGQNSQDSCGLKIVTGEEGEEGGVPHVTHRQDRTSAFAQKTTLS